MRECDEHEDNLHEDRSYYNVPELVRFREEERSFHLSDWCKISKIR